MGLWRLRVLYFVLLPAILIAAGVLTYTTWVTASRAARLGEQTIAESTLLLVREKVDGLERDLIGQENAAFRLVDPRFPTILRKTWLPRAEELTPTIAGVFVFDADLTPLAAVLRAEEPEAERLRSLVLERAVPDLELETQRTGRLKHLHRRYDDRSVLVASRAQRIRGRKVYYVALHDMGAIVDGQVAGLFASEEGKRQYNVVDRDNRRVYGPSLAGAGDYLVGLRFPTTLYNWRLQIAPKQAPLLESQRKNRRATDIALLSVALIVIVFGVFLLLFAAHKERRLNELRGELVANVSHELKTPLSVVRMFGELLLTKRVRSPEKEQQYLEIICRESERLTALIENVLDFSALERGQTKYALEERRLEDVVGQALDTFRYRVEREGTEVQLDVLGALPPVRIDEQAIVLALVNLLDNAVKYGQRTPITVSVEHVRDYVQVRVRDRGPGIPSEATKRIFDRFYRLKRDRKHRGSGIGLALVKHIADAHGGRAWARNAEDDEGGAIVAFNVPAMEPVVAAAGELAEARST